MLWLQPASGTQGTALGHQELMCDHQACLCVTVTHFRDMAVVGSPAIPRLCLQQSMQKAGTPSLHIVRAGQVSQGPKVQVVVSCTHVYVCVWAGVCACMGRVGIV